MRNDFNDDKVFPNFDNPIHAITVRDGVFSIATFSTKDNASNSHIIPSLHLIV